MINIAGWKTPVTDRTQADVDYAKSDYINNNPVEYKGAQNNTDWARLVGNMYIIANYLMQYGFDIKMKSKTQWNTPYPATDAEIQDIQNDLIQIRQAIGNLYGYTWQEWDALGQTWDEIDARHRMAVDYFSSFTMPEMPYTHYEKINDLETWTQALYDSISHMANMFRVSGTFASGQVSYLPRFIDVVSDFMTWFEWDMLGRRWEEIDAEQRTFADYFRKDI